MMLYRLHQLTQRLGGTTVLDIDHLTIEAGGIHALLGPNGAGKTTLLEILAFLEAPSSGTLCFKEHAVDYLHGDLLDLRRRVVLVDQHPIMFSTTVQANIEFGLKIRSIDTKARKRIIDEVLDIVGLSRYREARAHQLSGGETQRLALARALAIGAEVLLCDEPTASVDAENQAIITDLLRQINVERGTTIIFTTHDRLQAASLAQHTLTLENGRLTRATAENCYACTVQHRGDGKRVALVQGMREVRLPDHYAGQQASSGRISIHPDTIRLHPISAQHAPSHWLPGRVVLIMAEGERIRVVVNVGVLMVVLMDADTYHKKAPSIGADVALEITEEGLTFLPG